MRNLALSSLLAVLGAAMPVAIHHVAEASGCQPLLGTCKPTSAYPAGPRSSSPTAVIAPAASSGYFDASLGRWVEFGAPVDTSSGIPKPIGTVPNNTPGAQECTAPYTYFTLNGITATATFLNYCYSDGTQQYELYVTTNSNSSYMTYAENSSFCCGPTWWIRTWPCGTEEDFQSDQLNDSYATSFYEITPYLYYNGCGSQADDAWDYVVDENYDGVWVPYMSF